MTTIDELLEIKNNTEKEFNEKVKDALLEHLVNFYLDRQQMFDDRRKLWNELKTDMARELINNQFDPLEESFKKREDRYFELLNFQLGKRFITYENYQYQIDFREIFISWAKWIKAKTLSKEQKPKTP